MMKRVINWEHYRENWCDYGECMAELAFEGLVGLSCFIIMVFAFFLVLAGYEPMEDYS
jgi:hypothetical protein